MLWLLHTYIEFCWQVFFLNQTCRWYKCQWKISTHVVANNLNFDVILLVNLSVDCPGTQSVSAGKVEACAGCPNQSICASSQPKGPDKGQYSIKKDQICDWDL